MSTIQTKPPGAKLYLNNTYQGETPISVELDDGFLPGADYNARFELAGYETKKVVLSQEWHYGLIFLEGFLLGGLPGLALCALNCKTHYENYSFDLKPASAAGTPAPAVTASPSATGSAKPPSSPGGPPTSVDTSFLTGSKIAVLPTQIDKSAKAETPSLIDDYVLTAVQHLGKFDVIGQDDISALIGFDKQAQLFDCADTTCIANIGGALGVDHLIAFKVAKLGSDWVVTAKLINMREARVVSRISEIITGSATDLLRAVPGVTSNLFAAAKK
jgi:TolB-like protein